MSQVGKKDISKEVIDIIHKPNERKFTCTWSWSCFKYSRASSSIEALSKNNSKKKRIVVFCKINQLNEEANDYKYM